MRELKAMVMVDLNRLFKVSAVLVPAMLALMIFRVSEGRWEGIFSYGFYVLLAAVIVFYADIGRDGEEKAFLLLDSLPLRRRTVMISHHLMTSILLIVFEVMVSAVLVAGSALGVAVDAEWPVTAAGEMGIMLSIFSIMIPVYIGFETAWKGLVLLAPVTFVVSGLLGFRGGLLPVPRVARPQSFVDWFLGATPWLLLLVGLVAWVVSLFVSIRNYERQDH